MTSEMGWLTQEGYEALWTLNMLLYPEHTMEYLGYLGYNSDTRGNQLTAVQGSYFQVERFYEVQFQNQEHER